MILDKNMERAKLFGMMAPNIMANGSQIKDQETESILALMVLNILANGTKT